MSEQIVLFTASYVPFKLLINVKHMVILKTQWMALKGKLKEHEKCNVYCLDPTQELSHQDVGVIDSEQSPDIQKMSDQKFEST